jgi:8-oxo-dGTP pyrophosphatase MutT (NUDIX family)
VNSLRLRDAARAVVLDPEERVLLVRFEFPRRRGWATPGGGIDPGESDEAAIRRELAKETGLETCAPSFERAPRLTWAQLNAECVTALRWWSLAELQASEERFAPRRLPSLLAELVRAGPPAEPLDAGV